MHCEGVGGKTRMLQGVARRTAEHSKKSAKVLQGSSRGR